jgi:hypothetical protein
MKALSLQEAINAVNLAKDKIEILKNQQHMAEKELSKATNEVKTTKAR